MFRRWCSAHSVASLSTVIVRKGGMKFFLDTEFTGLHGDAKLISLALVTATGDEFYVELTDTYCFDDCSDFVVETVLPQLDLQRHGQTIAGAKARLQKFIERFDVDLEVCSDAPTWDWPFFCQLAQVEGKWPANVLLEPTDLNEMCSGVELTADSENLLVEPPHHALADARLMRDICLQIEASR